MQDDPAPKSALIRLWAVLRTIAWIVALPLLFAIVAAVLMVNQDINAPGWIKSRIEDRAAEVMGGGALQFGEIYINVGRDLHPRVRLVDTRITDADGRQIAQIPSVSGGISPRGVLFQGDVLMQDVTLTGAQINLRRASDGSVAMDFGDGAGFDTAPSLAALLDQSDQVLGRPVFEALEQIHATGLIINYIDAQAGRRWTVDGGQIDLDLRNDQTDLSGDFVLLSGGADITRLQLTYQSPRGARTADIGVSLTNARANDIATQTPALAWLADVDAAITASLRTGFDENGALGPLSATLSLGAGALQPNAATDPLTFDAAKAYLTYDPATDQIAFNQISVDAAAGQFEASGEAYLRDIVDGVPKGLVAQFSFPQASLAAGPIYEAGLALPPISVDMRMRFRPFAVDLGQLALVDGETRLTASGRAEATENGWKVALDAHADQIEATRFTALWPQGMKPKSRAWLANNVSAGTIRDAQFGIRFEQAQRPVMATQFDFDGATVKYLKAFPPIQGGAGIASLQDNQLILSLDRGTVSAPSGGAADLSGSTFIVTDTRVPGSLAELDLKLNSSVTAALSLLDQEPFRVMTKAGRGVDIATGRAQVAGQVTFPLRKAVPRSDIAYDFSARLLDLQSDTIIKDRDLRANQLRLTATPELVRIAGPATVDGIAVDGAWSQRIGPELAGKSRLEATIALSPRFLETFNIALPPGSVAGAGQGNLTVDLQKGRAPAFSLTSNLRGIAVALPAVGWRKGPSSGGELIVAGALGPVPQIDRLEISGGGLSAKGAVTMNSDGTMDRAEFTQLRIGNWLNAPVTVRGRGRGRPVGVTIPTGRLDLRGAAFGAGGQSGPLALRLDRLQITEGITLHNFRGDFAGGASLSGEFSGLVNGGPRIVGTVVPQNGRSAIRLRSDDAGGAVAAAGFVKNGVGGALDVTLTPTGGAGTFDGALSVRGLRVRDAPAMAALLDSISVVGLLRQLDGQGLAFDEVDATFRLTPTQVVVTQSSAVGPGLGISLDGIYTLASKQVDFQGVVSPFYLLNGIGSIFTRKGEGLIGFNFNLTGAASAPSVSVNPLSAFTPGMFREIFRRPPPQVTQ